MDFMPEDGFCCPFVEKWSSTSEYEPRISKFIAWVKSLPVKPPHHKRYPIASNTAPLKDQPFVIKIVEDGYAFMFHGAFAPREGQGDCGGFDRIPYFDLITSDFEKIEFDGEASEIVVCEKHGKRFLLHIYLKAPIANDRCPKELRMTESGLRVLEKSCGGRENDDLPVTVTGRVVTGEEDGEDTTVLVAIEHNPKCHGIHRSQERSSYLQSDNDTWAWFG